MIRRSRIDRLLRDNHAAYSKASSRIMKKKAGLDRLDLPEVTTRDANEFYAGFRPFINTDTKEPVLQLNDHQVEIWNHQFMYVNRMYPKSQKITITTVCILEDIYHALTDAMGLEIVITGQTASHAQNHLLDFKKYIRESIYKDYLIDSSTGSYNDVIRSGIDSLGLELNEKTKATMALLHNPNHPSRPTRVYALGATSGTMLSLKYVKHIHASDITKSKEVPEKQKQTYVELKSRLANSKGSIVFESLPPFGEVGPMASEWDLYNKLMEKNPAFDLSKLSRAEQRAYPMFIKPYDYTYGIKAGVLDAPFIEGERNSHGVLFDMYYGAKIVKEGTTLFGEELFRTSDNATDFYCS